MRLIDADAFLEKMKRTNRYFDLKFDIEEMPTVDSVPGVRCRDCKHHRVKNENERQYLVEDILICTNPDATYNCWNAVWPDHFCSYGVTVQEVKK